MHMMNKKGKHVNIHYKKKKKNISQNQLVICYPFLEASKSNIHSIKTKTQANNELHHPKFQYNVCKILSLLLRSFYIYILFGEEKFKSHLSQKLKPRKEQFNYKTIPSSI